ncbi:MAG: ROK family protein [Methanomicrobiales archaeon]|nr:ROK family protein [Methanomicrobiales archaeon]
MENQNSSLDIMKKLKKLVAGAADIGGTNTRVGIINQEGGVIRVARFKTPVDGQPEDIPKIIGEKFSELTSDEYQLAGIGVAVAGPVDLKSGILNHPPNIPFDAVPVVSILKEETGYPVHLINDCQAAVLGEVLVGGAQGFNHVVYITISTGIGGGVFTGGRIIRGRGGNAAEIGHFPVDNTFSFPCTCGYNGHWEGYASGRAIPTFYQKWCSRNKIPVHGNEKTPEILERIFRKEEKDHDFRDALAKINGRGLSAVIVAYDPECIIIDGTVIRKYPELLKDAIAYTDRYLKLPKFLISPLNGDAPLIGAGMVVFHPDIS